MKMNMQISPCLMRTPLRRRTPSTGVHSRTSITPFLAPSKAHHCTYPLQASSGTKPSDSPCVAAAFNTTHTASSAPGRKNAMGNSCDLPPRGGTSALPRGPPHLPSQHTRVRAEASTPSSRQTHHARPTYAILGDPRIRQWLPRRSWRESEAERGLVRWRSRELPPPTPFLATSLTPF